MCSSIAKCLLIMINMLFLVIAVALIAAGVILAFVPSTVLESAYKQAQSEAASKGYSLPDSAKDLKDIPLVYQVGIALFVFGIFLFVVSTLGWCGSCCNSCCRWMLIAFSIIMVMLMIAEIVVGTLFLVTDSPLHNSLKRELKAKIKSDYDEQGKDPFSVAINLVNKYFECCGIDGGADFGTKLHRSCELQNEFTGCYSKMTKLIKDNIIWAGLVLAGILFIQLLEIIFAVVVYKSGTKNKVEPMKPYPGGQRPHYY